MSLLRNVWRTNAAEYPLIIPYLYAMETALVNLSKKNLLKAICGQD